MVKAGRLEPWTETTPAIAAPRAVAPVGAHSALFRALLVPVIFSKLSASAAVKTLRFYNTVNLLIHHRMQIHACWSVLPNDGTHKVVPARSRC